ncbi:MAG: ATP-grasp fold amidoligase family protein [Anaerolineaceae bacterium]|nr:ATP-grasp fold amidoligase family protein [Anaerolineaceae bacterium]
MLAKRMAAILCKGLPANNLGDGLYAWMHYLVNQRRLPGGKYSGRLNDYLYRLKVDGTLLDPMYQFVCDKEYAKYYISAVVGRQFTLKTLQVLRNDDDVDSLQLDHFPCVVKPSHLSGQVQFCYENDKSLDRDLMKGWLRKNLYRISRPQDYKHLTPKILVEEFFSGDGLSVPNDYKIFCFGGSPAFIQVDADRFTCHTRNFYDTSWKRMPLTLMYPSREEDDPRPGQLERMLEIAARLSAPFPFIRVDLYASSKAIKVGELASIPESAGGRIEPPSGEYVLGRFVPGSDANTRRAPA